MLVERNTGGSYRKVRDGGSNEIPPRAAEEEVSAYFPLGYSCAGAE